MFLSKNLLKNDEFFSKNCQNGKKSSKMGKNCLKMSKDRQKSEDHAKFSRNSAKIRCGRGASPSHCAHMQEILKKIYANKIFRI